MRHGNREKGGGEEGDDLSGHRVIVKGFLPRKRCSAGDTATDPVV